LRGKVGSLYNIPSSDVKGIFELLKSKEQRVSSHSTFFVRKRMSTDLIVRVAAQ